MRHRPGIRAGGRFEPGDVLDDGPGFGVSVKPGLAHNPSRSRRARISLESRVGIESPRPERLALGFIARAIHLAERSGENEWSGPGAQLALAKVAIDAGEYDIALTALAHAQADDRRNGHSTQIEDLLGEVRNERDDPQPQVSLASLLERLPA